MKALRIAALIAAPLLVSPCLAAMPALADDDMAVHDRIEQVLGFADDLDEPMLSAREAIVNGDAAALAEVTEFPLRTSNGEIADADELAERMDEVVTPAVRKAIKSMTYGDLIVSSDGVGMGNGAVWMNLICDDSACNEAHWAVISINN
ncbi:hypothetical protein [Gellertiella hungarica]|uniref:Uncharacterized protein n=1 Tax=Gellertiella hungarica TaxID=1572859 RepID=A0A7W6NIR5_9HYPH|nr:hypothetical protein [Gellertiella hungarica]MBB4063620.1 hypothetical protein [Gellertiella hungarica]